MKIPKVGSDLVSGHHFLLQRLHKPLKLLTFSSTWTQAVDISHPQYTNTKRGVFYFSKSFPTDLGHHCLKLGIVQGLKTKSQAQARFASQKLLSRLDDCWLSFRHREVEIPAAHLLRHAPSLNPDSVLPTIVDALELYHQVLGENKKKPLFTRGKRSVAYLIQSIGCRSLDQYSSADAVSFRGWLRDEGLSTGSIQRNFTSIKAMVRFTINELGLNYRNAFSGVYLTPEANKQKRQPLGVDQIRPHSALGYLPPVEYAERGA